MNSEPIPTVDQWIDPSYYAVTELPSGETAALFNFLFTTGLIVGLTPASYRVRYCYENRLDAMEALSLWDGQGDPSGPWIKAKGDGTDRLGPGALTE